MIKFWISNVIMLILNGCLNLVENWRSFNSEICGIIMLLVHWCGRLQRGRTKMVTGMKQGFTSFVRSQSTNSSNWTCSLCNSLPIYLAEMLACVPTVWSLPLKLVLWLIQLGRTQICKTCLESWASMTGFNGRSTAWFLLCPTSLGNSAVLIFLTFCQPPLMVQFKHFLSSPSVVYYHIPSQADLVLFCLLSTHIGFPVDVTARFVGMFSGWLPLPWFPGF